MSTPEPIADSTYYPTEIHRLLKIGDNLILPPTPVKYVEQPKTELKFEEIETKPNWISKAYQSNLFIYPMVFVVAFAFFYSVFNFQSLISQVQGWFAKNEDQQVLGDNLTEYYSWMGGYFFSVGNKESLEPASDIDRDGLSNMDEFIIQTNPIIADSDSDGFSDGIELINSTNPWGDGPMNDRQRKLAEGIDLIKVNNRISFNLAVATKGDSGNILGSSKINHDLSRQGMLSISKLNLQVPIVWSKDPKDFEADLTRGVVHYPGTALPGEQGTVYISGHSSDYPWKRHPYKQVFARLNALDVGDDIFIDIYDIQGKLHNYRYRVSSENVYKPDDQSQFIDNSAAKLNLSTCWPIGTAKDRYVVTAILQNL